MNITSDDFTVFCISPLRFDILVNGGGSVTLQFLRQPYEAQQTTVMVPWNQMVTMDTVTLTFSGEVLEEDAKCADVSHDHYSLRPVVISTWQHTQLGACTRESAVIPESQVSDNRGSIA